jgi:hypothetical protein
VQALGLLRHRHVLLDGVRVAQVRVRLHAVAERVRVLEQERAVLLEGVRIGQEHGLGGHDLLVHGRQELLHRVRLLLAQRVVALPELLELLLALREQLLVLAVLADQRAGGDHGRLELARLVGLDEVHEGVEAADLQHDLGVVRRELHRALDVEVVLGADCAVAPAQHVHGLAAWGGEGGGERAQEEMG